MPNNPGMVGIGEYVKSRRDALGEGQGKFADRAGLPRPYMSQLEAGKVGLPGADIRRRLAAALGVTHLDLLVAAGELTEDEAGRDRPSGTYLNLSALAPDDPAHRILALVSVVDWTQPGMRDGIVAMLEKLPRRAKGEPQ